jgi:hypothetical protein
MHESIRSRLARNVGVRALSDFLPKDAPISFGVFAGSSDQRLCVALCCTAPALGRMPVVLVHNDLMLERGLCTLAQQRHVSVMLAGPRPMATPTVTYDPLFGLDHLGVIRTLGVEKDHALAARVLDYLTIADAMHNMSGGADAIGKYPYRLHLLRALSHMNYQRLESEVLDLLPGDLAEDLAMRMTMPGDQRKVADLFDALALRLGTIVSPQQDPGLAVRHPLPSVSSIALAGGFASVRLPTKDEAVLNHLAIELDLLLRHGMVPMLVMSGVDIAKTDLAALIATQAPHKALCVGLACDYATRVVDSNTDVPSLLSTLDRTFVLSCPNTGIASAFTDAFGTYERTVIERGRHQSREFMQLLPSSVGAGINERITQEANVLPEELVGNPTVALVCGRGMPRPYVVKRFDERR